MTVFGPDFPGEPLDVAVSAWAERCAASGADAASCSGPEARFLLAALVPALAAGAATPELGRAARNWGARFAAPVHSLIALTALREALLERPGLLGASVAGVVSLAGEGFDRVFDQLRIEGVEAASASLRAAARTDPLTGCANRLALEEDLAHATANAERSGLELAVAMVDLAGLKRINDSQGHAAGDEALKGLVDNLRGVMRHADTLYRTGGDEFVVVAPFTDAAGIEAMLRRAEEAGGPRFRWGIATLALLGAAAVATPELLVSAADKDLYARRRSRSRRLGRAVRRDLAMLAAGATGLVVLSRRQVTGLGVVSRRHVAALGAVAASMLLVAGAAFGLTALLGQHPSQAGVAIGGTSGRARPHVNFEPGAKRGVGSGSVSPTHGGSGASAPAGPTSTTQPVTSGAGGGAGSDDLTSVSPPATTTAPTTTTPPATTTTTTPPTTTTPTTTTIPGKSSPPPGPSPKPPPMQRPPPPRGGPTPLAKHPGSHGQAKGQHKARGQAGRKGHPAGKPHKHAGKQHHKAPKSGWKLRLAALLRNLW